MLYPFSEIGVADQFEDLYNLSQSLLDAEAADAKADFKMWVESKFDLTTGQQLFLDGLNPEWLEYNGMIVSVAMRSRQPVSVDLSAVAAPESSKIIRSEATLAVAPGSSIGTDATGAINFVTDYV